MRINLVAIIILLVINILVDIYIARAIRCRISQRWMIKLFYGICGISYGLIILLAVMPLGGLLPDSQFHLFMWLLLAFVALLVPRYVFVIIDLLAHIPLLFKRKRSRLVSATACIAAGIAIIMILWGTFVTRKSLQIKDVTVEITNLPKAFDGYRIVQFSDLHTGSFGTDDTFIRKLVAEINKIDADLVVFTGDIVNRHANEIRPFINALSEIKGRDGQLAVLGNHDYADYYYTDSNLRENDRARLINFYSLTSFDLILDDYRTIYRGNDSIVVIGVENIGRPPFAVYGNLDIAYPNLDDNVTKILLSHDPHHWHNDIANHHNKNIALTLSGHTHALQTCLFGWSPASLIHSEWSGLYADANKQHQLYVNIGIGTVGTPMRIGASPEITVITLRQKR